MSTKKTIPKKKATKKKGRATKSKKDSQVVVSANKVAIEIAANGFRQGFSEALVEETLKEQFKHFTPFNIQYAIHEGSKVVASQYARDRKSIVSLHVRRYDLEVQEVIEFFEKEHYEQIDPKVRFKIMAAKIMYAVEALGAKERVLQIHTKDTQVKIFNKLNAKIKEKKTLFDLSKLTLAEKIEFLSLMQKTKKSQGEIFGVIMSADKKQNAIEDIEFEEVKNDNITKIKQTNLPETINQEDVPKTINDLTDKLHKALQAKAKKDFEAKDATETKGPEIINATKKKN